MLGERPNQVARLREDVVPDEAALLSIPDTPGEVTEAGLRTNVSVGVRYLDAWLHGVGAAAIDNLMEDAATAEISRSQVWQWVRSGRFDEAHVRRTRSRPSTRARRRRSCSRSSRSRRNSSSSSRFPRTLGWNEPRQHQGRRHRARDRGGDRLGGARPGNRPPAGAALGAVQRLADAGARGAAAARGARARLVRAEPRRPRADDRARGAARGVHGPRRAGRARDRGGRDEDDAGGPRRSSTSASSGSRGSRRSFARASRATSAARSWATGCARITRSTT